MFADRVRIFIKSAIRTASRNIKLSTEAYMTISTLAGFNKNAEILFLWSIKALIHSVISDITFPPFYI